MKNLKTLFNCGIDVLIDGIQINSKQVKKGDLFICRKGINSDGHDFIPQAIKNGASKIIAEEGEYSVPYEIVKDSREYLNDYLKDNSNIQLNY